MSNLTIPDYMKEPESEAKWAFLFRYLNISDSFQGVDHKGRIKVGDKDKSLISMLGASWPHFLEKKDINLVNLGLASVEAITKQFMEHMGKKTASMKTQDVCNFVADKIWIAKHESQAIANPIYREAATICFSLRLERALKYECVGRQSKLIGSQIANAIQGDPEIVKAIADGSTDRALGLLSGIVAEVVQANHSLLVAALNNITASQPKSLQGGIE